MRLSQESDNMKITYLYHSGFCVELEKQIFIFDYFKGVLPSFDGRKPIYAFVSHKHQDHFTMQIFKWLEQYEEVHYFLGSDVKLSDKYLERNGVSVNVKQYITNIGKNKTKEFKDLRIETLKSTDAGVAFLVSTKEISIYHAGDLNWWHWNGETKEYNEAMEKAYKKEIDSICGRNFDIAFVPLDPRLEDAYDKGMNYFLSCVSAERVFPMHMWDEYEIVKKYKKTIEGRKYAASIRDIETPGQTFEE